MKGRPLCVASVLLAAIIFFGNAFFSSEEDKETVYESMQLICQVEQIQGLKNSQTLVVCDVMKGDRLFCKRMKVYESFGKSLFTGLKIGQIISLDGTVSSFSKPGNPGQFNEYQYYREQGIQYKFFAKVLTIKKNSYNKLEQWLYELRTACCENLQKCLPEDEAGIMAAMIFGEKSGLSTEIKDLYQTNGIAHILAISGLHVSLLGAGVFFLLRRYVMPMKAAACVTAAFLLLYGELTGFSVSTKRAVIMMLCMLGARFLGKRYDRLSALALSAIIQLVFQPALLFQSGFLLSYGTVLGITVFLEPFHDLVMKKNKFGSAIISSLCVFLVTFPIVLYFSYQYNPYSVLVNVMILPFMSALIVMTIGGSSLAAIWSVGGNFVSGTAHFILRYYHIICQWTERLPGSCIITGQPDLWQIILYYFFFGIFCFYPCKRKRNVFFLVSALVILLLPKQPSSGFTITNLDVGQGDCACLQVPGATVLIDGGSSDVSQIAKYRIAPFLKSQGIGELTYLFLTHSDSDHINGIQEILENTTHMGFSIGTVVLPAIKNPDEEYRKIEQLCRSAAVPVKKMQAGDTLQTGALTFRCLHPASGYEWKSENNYSLVLQVEYGKFKGLFTGDLEMEAESEILSELSRTDYLKVSHHGSKGASGDEFLEKTSPDVSVISAGERNRYGHPAKETIERLLTVTSKIFSTMNDGAVTLYTDGETWRVRTFG